MQEKLAGIEAAAASAEGGSRGVTGSRGGRGGANSSGSGGPARRPLQSAHKRDGLPVSDHAAGRGVSFSPETRDIERTQRLTRQPTPHHRGGPHRANPRGGTGWMPYLVVTFLICLGPARPLLVTLLSELVGPVFGELSLFGGAPKEVPWYDSE